MSKEEKKVKILSEFEFDTYPKIGETKRVVAVTYQIEGMSPRTVWIDKDKYTDENLKKLIQEDLEKAKKGGVRELTL